MAAPDDYIGAIVAQKYRVLELLGEGGMGKVYKATQLALDKPVVLKVLRHALLGDERTVARFQLEARAASRLNHPNSISVLDFGQVEDGAMFIAMEYVAGRDLHQVLSTDWPLPEQRIIRIMAQVLGALGDAHGAGVIHRDLKPENIMLEQRRGQPDFVKVLDFGIAKIIDEVDEGGPTLTRAGFVCGTPEYMSPEQARGGKVDPRSDLYAVGVILYQLCSGHLPFESDSAIGFATKHLTELPVPPSRRRPDARVSSPLEGLIMRALAKSPDERPQSAELFRAELLELERELRARGGTRATGGVATGLARASAPIGLGETLPPVDTNAENPAASSSSSGEVPATADRRASTERQLPLDAVDEVAPTELEEVGEPAGSTAFAWGAALLVGFAATLGAAYLFQLFGRSPDVFVTQPAEPPALASPTPAQVWERSIPLLDRRPGDAAALALEGDAAWQARRFELALDRYLAAWKMDTSPELALKLGELAFQRGDLEFARGFWDRFRRERPTSRAIGYLDRVLPANSAAPPAESPSSPSPPSSLPR